MSAGPSLCPVPTVMDPPAASSTPSYALTVVGQSAPAVGLATTARNAPTLPWHSSGRESLHVPGKTRRKGVSDKSRVHNFALKRS